jgi:Mg2+-importing ATPase
MGPAEVLTQLASDPDGLSTVEAADRLRQFGANSLGTRRVSAGTVLLRQIRNPILILLVGAALLSALTGGGANAAIIMVIVALSVGLGFFNEYRAEAAMATLRSQIHHDAEVLRDGRSCHVLVDNLVPGDVVALRVGAIVPADLRLLAVDELECDEGVLTGESMPASKSAEAVTGSTDPDRPGCAFMGTVVHQGSGSGVVVLTGTATAFGRIAAGLGEKQSRTAFEVGLSRFSQFLFGVAAVLTAFIFIVNVALSRPLIEALLFSLAIAVGIAPEMMPAIVTVSLSSGAKALVAKRVMVKRLVAIEDLGNIEILFTDKTGTLTEGVITFGQSLDPAGKDSARPLVLGLVCNEAAVTEQGPVGGNALDQALWRATSASESSPSTTSASWPLYW